MEAVLIGFFRIMIVTIALSLLQDVIIIGDNSQDAVTDSSDVPAIDSAPVDCALDLRLVLMRF
jgi:hypothetical protein